jgi:hypothetical protein
MRIIVRGFFFIAIGIVAFGVMPEATEAAPVLPGELVISEVMANPSLVPDADGEWFELFNPTASSIDLNGLVLSDDGLDSHTITGSVIIAPGGYLVLGSNGNPASNGGYSPDYVYSTFLLANSEDEIVISEGATEIARLNYTVGFVVSGASRELPFGASPPFTESQYTLATTPYGDGDLGTPGTVIPEPHTALMVGLGLLGIAIAGRRGAFVSA